MTKKGKKGLQSLGQMLKDYDLSRKKYITREFQDYGYRLACQLDDVKNKSLYIKLAKELPRKILEEALIFVKDASNVRSKAKLFMWKLKQIKNEKLKMKNNKLKSKKK